MGNFFSLKQAGVQKKDYDGLNNLERELKKLTKELSAYLPPVRIQTFYDDGNSANDLALYDDMGRLNVGRHMVFQERLRLAARIKELEHKISTLKNQKDTSCRFYVGKSKGTV